MAEEDDVTRLVRSSLEAKGVLASIRAELLAAVFTSVDDKEREAGVHRERPAHVTALLASAEGSLLQSLVTEYLEFLQLDATASCLRSEVGEFARSETRLRLAAKLGLSPDAPGPLLLQLLPTTD